MIRLLVIVGPTATGKTRMAVRIAHRLGSEIISADSRQVYRGMDIGTGKDLEEYQEVDPPVAVHLLDVADPRETYSLFRYQQDFYRVVSERSLSPPFNEGTPLIVAGGTGLYVEAVLKGYSLADVPPDPGLRAVLERQSLPELIALLQDEDRNRLAHTDCSTKRRVIRAIEISRMGHLKEVEDGGAPPPSFRHVVYGVRLDREELRQSIGARLEARLAEGLVAEVQGLLDRGVPSERLHQLGLEYREVNASLQGEKSLDQMVTDLGKGIYQLARRQETWFRGLERRGIPIIWVAAGDWRAVLRDWGSRDLEGP